jgi:hypothetical protein
MSLLCVDNMTGAKYVEINSSPSLFEDICVLESHAGDSVGRELWRPDGSGGEAATELWRQKGIT